MTESSSVVVPLDGSAFSEQALPVASGIAARWRVPLRLVRVHVPVALEVHCADGLAIIDDKRDGEARVRESSYLVDRVHDLDCPAPIEALLLDGHVSSALAREVARSGAALVVMATHGRSGFQRWWRGSVADALVRHSQAPVLLLHPADSATQPQPFRRVLVPLDDSERARSILSDVSCLAEPGAELVLLTVIEPSAWQTRPTDGGPVVPDEAEREAAAASCLEEVARPLRARGFSVSTQVRVSRRCAQEILAVARDRDVDLVALATHGRSGLARAALGSVADEVVHHCEVPVLLRRLRTDTGRHERGGRRAERAGETRPGPPLE